MSSIPSLLKILIMTGSDMKKHFLAAYLALAAIPAFSAEPSYLAGLCFAENLIEEGAFETAKPVLPLYSPTLDMKGTILSIVNIQKLGKHRFEIRFIDKNNNVFDRCLFSPRQVNKVPHVETLKCSTSGYWPGGGVQFSVYDTYKGQTKKLGSITLADWTSNMNPD